MSIDAVKPHPLSYLYSGRQISAGQAEAAWLLSVTEPAKLAYSRSLNGDELEAQRTVLRGFIARRAYEHLYPAGFPGRGQSDSQAAFDARLEAEKVLAEYPAVEALKNIGVEMDDDVLLTKDKDSNLTDASQKFDPLTKTDHDYYEGYVNESAEYRFNRAIFCDYYYNFDHQSAPRAEEITLKACEEPRLTFPLPYRQKMIGVNRAVLLDWIFNKELMKTVGKQRRDFRVYCPRERVTISKGEMLWNVLTLMHGLENLNDHASPLMHHLIYDLMIKPPTGLPFNVNIPF